MTAQQIAAAIQQLSDSEDSFHPHISLEIEGLWIEALNTGLWDEVNDLLTEGK